MCHYGVMLKNSKGIDHSYSEALKYFKMAANKGDIDGINNLAVMLETGEGMERDYSKAI